MALAGLDTDLRDYRLVDRIAIGGMAEVFLAEAADPAAHDGQARVILKRLLPKFRAEKAFVSLFMDEAKLCVKLRHPHIVRTFKAFKKGLDYYMVQELVEGASLATVMLRLRKRKLRCPPAAALALAIGLLKALDYVHRARLGEQHVRLVHRDVNPGNILVAGDGMVKLTDFGVAEGEGVGAERVEGALRGTPPYMSPEQVRGAAVTPTTDLFSAAIVLWEVLTGRDLFLGETQYETLRRVVEHEAAPPSVYADVPETLDAVLAQALAKKPEARYASATEFGRALMAVGRENDWGSGDKALLGTVVGHALAS
jgi:eukaryotic-like serine/threonine-protein kinase